MSDHSMHYIRMSLSTLLIGVMIYILIFGYTVDNWWDHLFIFYACYIFFTMWFDVFLKKISFSGKGINRQWFTVASRGSDRFFLARDRETIELTFTGNIANHKRSKKLIVMKPFQSDRLTTIQIRFMKLMTWRWKIYDPKNPLA